MPKVDCEIETQVNEIFVKTVVTQNFINPEDKPLELKICLLKDPNILFNSFKAKIGDSIIVKSKVINKEKTLIKYTDAIASGNAAIFVAEDEENNTIIINMGNIPPKEKVVFISEFIYYIKYTNYYEFEIFRKLPMFLRNDSAKYSSKLKEKIIIKTKNKISTLSKDINVENLKILEEKYLNEEKTEYLFVYELEKLPRSYYKDINTSKIYFDTIYTEPKIFLQKSKKIEEDNYIIQYKYKDIKSDNNNFDIPPCLFIFLLDQSGSMNGNKIEISKKAIEIFLQSLPAKSYYQLIGFGSNFVKYDETPKEYNQENINQSIKCIKTLKAELGGTNIYDPLKNIFEDKIYDNIELNRKIFLLTDGKIEDRDVTLELIKNNNSKFNIFAIGVGKNFDEYLIKTAGYYGKGSYNYCRDMNELNSIISREINNANNSWVSDFRIICNLDNENIIKKTEINQMIKNDDIINCKYIIPRKKVDKINIEISYILNEKEEIKSKYEINPVEYSEGEEFSKLFMKEYLKDFSKNEKLDKLIKYQILDENTSLYAEIELSNKITEEMKSKIIGNKENKYLLVYNPNFRKPKKDLAFSCLGNPFSTNQILLKKLRYNDNDNESNYVSSGGIYGSYYNDKSSEINEDKKHKIEEEKAKLNIEEIKKKKIEEKEKIMKMIKTQDFIEGFWDINETTKFIIEKYKIEYDKLKIKYLNDKIIITILVIYHLNKECFGLMNELIMIIKKAKDFIQKEINCSYEDIVEKL